MHRARPFALLAISLVALSIGWYSAVGEEQTIPAVDAAETSPSPQYVPTVDEARRQAVLLHAAIHSSLQRVHSRYYREDEGLPIPAAILKEVFHDLEQEQQVKLRWLVVEGQAMNVDHEPQDLFEQEAVQALKAKRAFHEQVIDGTYRRAAPIRLSNHCLKCHVPDRRSTRDRIAGLVTQIPVRMP